MWKCSADYSTESPITESHSGVKKTLPGGETEWKTMGARDRSRPRQAANWQQEAAPGAVFSVIKQ